jgi:hypothetical protein
MKFNMQFATVLVAAGLAQASKFSSQQSAQTVIDDNGSIPGNSEIINCGLPDDVIQFTYMNINPSPIKPYVTNTHSSAPVYL